MNSLAEFKKQFIPDPNEVLLIKSLFMHPGWIRYEERIKQTIDMLDYNIAQLTGGTSPITNENLPVLNQQINERRMLKLMLLFKEDLLDEVKTEELEEQLPKDFTVPD